MDKIKAYDTIDLIELIKNISDGKNGFREGKIVKVDMRDIDVLDKSDMVIINKLKELMDNKKIPLDIQMSQSAENDMKQFVSA